MVEGVGLDVESGEDLSVPIVKITHIIHILFIQV